MVSGIAPTMRWNYLYTPCDLSKIKIKQIFSDSTLGFRGEAPGLHRVCQRFGLVGRRGGWRVSHGTKLVARGGREVVPRDYPVGIWVCVEDLIFNTLPASRI